MTKDTTVSLSPVPDDSQLADAGADSVFFLGGGAPVRNGVTDFFCRIPVVLDSRRLSRGGEDAHPLHPPPRSAPVTPLRTIRE